MSPIENEMYVKTLPGPRPFPLVAANITSNVKFSPAQHKQIALMNLAYFNSVADLDKKYINNLSKIIDNVSLKG
jgi:hypothetical protein